VFDRILRQKEKRLGHASLADRWRKVNTDSEWVAGATVVAAAATDERHGD